VGAGTERILLVDDELAILRMEKQMLERLGYKVQELTSGVDAWKTFKADPNAYDLVITDMSMPTMTGEQLTREILSIRPGMPILLSTGFSEKMNAEAAKALGVKGLLMKPIVKSALATEVRRVLDECKKRSA
jgi:CheY-like chemotaxis protein